MAISNNSKEILNRMNKRAAKVGLGTVIQAVENKVNGKTIVHCALHTTAGGAAAEAISISGVLSSDQVFVNVQDDGTNNVTILKAVPSADTVTVTFSGDPSSDAIVSVLVIR